MNISESLERFYQFEDEGDRRRYRDKVIGLYLAEEGARFNEAKNAIRADMREGSFLLDTLTTGLSSAAAVASKELANTLSASAAATGTIRSSFNKNIYFESALNTILTEMTTAHDAASLTIRQQMKKPAYEYGLAEFFDDLRRLEGARGFNEAVQTVAAKSAAAAEDKAQELEQEFKATIIMPPPTLEMVGYSREAKGLLNANLGASPTERSAAIAAAAAALGLPAAGSDLDSFEQIMKQFAESRNVETSKMLFDKVNAAITAVKAAPKP